MVSPPLPGAGDRVLSADAQREFWYHAFHQLDVADQIIDGDRSAVRAYLRHFWSHWSGPAFHQPEADLDRLVDLYGAPGAFTASIGCTAPAFSYATLHPLPGIGHFSPLEAPERFASAIRDALSTGEARH